MKLTLKMVLVFLLLTGFTLNAALFSMYFIEKRHLADQWRQNRRNTTERLANVCADSILNSDELARLNYLKTMLASGEPGLVDSVVLLDGSGRILVHSDFLKGDLALKNRPADKPYIGWLAEPQYTEHRFAAGGRRFLASVSPVFTAGRKLGGIVTVVYDEAALELLIKNLQMETFKRSIQVMLIGMSLCVIVSIVLAKTLTSPIKTLVEGTKKIGAGDFSYRMPVKRADELGDLSREFNFMAKKLAELDELKDNFLATITHDLRNPLGCIIGYADLLYMGLQGELTPLQKKSLETIVKSGNFLAELINNILDITKMEAGHMEFEKKDIDVGKLLQEARDLMQIKAKEYNVNLELRISDDLTVIRGDQPALYRVVTNLISNALKFTPEGGKVSVMACKDSGGNASVSVKDTGIGIPKDKIGDLFSKFIQIKHDGDLPRKVKGTGLGLAISKEIVEAHGGRIWATSEPGKGAAFIFTLPP